MQIIVHSHAVINQTLGAKPCPGRQNITNELIVKKMY